LEDALALGWLSSAEKERLNAASDWNAVLDAIMAKRRGKEYRLEGGKLIEAEKSESTWLQLLTEYSRNKLSAGAFKDNQDRLLSERRKKLKVLRSKQKKLQQQVDDSQRAASYKEKADLLMANLHLVPESVKEVILRDFVDERDVRIALNSKLSPQANAERLYRKSKNERIQKEHLAKALQAVESEMKSIESEIAEISSSNRLKDLKVYIRSSELASKDVRLPYLRTEVDGLEVRIGRSAKDNDELLRNHSSPNDLWFHAYQVSGSHVILRLNKGHRCPESTLEAVASLAAHYSKARSEALIRVIYTYRKFVRKPKGANPGAVLVQSERSLLVPPRKIS